MIRSDDDDEEEKPKHWDSPKPYGEHGGRMQCPECGSYNTNQSTYSDYCNSCDWSIGY